MHKTSTPHVRARTCKGADYAFTRVGGAYRAATMADGRRAEMLEAAFA